MEVPKTDWDKIIKEQEEIQGPAITKLIREVAEGIETYGDEFFDPSNKEAKTDGSTRGSKRT